MPIRGWEVPNIVAAADMEDHLHNEDLAQEVVAGGQQSINNLMLVLHGSLTREFGFEYRLTTTPSADFLEFLGRLTGCE